MSINHPQPRSLMTSARNALAGVIGRVGPVHKMPPSEALHQLRSGQVKKVLFIRPHQGIGDLLLATPVLRAFKTAYPAVALHLLASAHNVVAVKDNPRLDKVWVWTRAAARHPLACLRLLRALRRERFDVALPLVSNTPSFTSLLIARCAGARLIWSYDTAGSYGGTNWSRRLANVEVPPPGAEAPEHQKFSQLVQALVPAVDPEPEFVVPVEDEASMEALWPAFFAPGKRIVGLFLGGNAERQDRLWLPAAWAELARLLQEAGIHVIAVCPPKNLKAGGGAPEADFYGEFCRLLGRDVPVFDEKGMGKAAALVRRLDLFVCPDGGLFHVSCAAGAKTLGLFFGTDLARWRPPVPWVTVLKAPQDDPSSLSPETVYLAVLQALVVIA